MPHASAVVPVVVRQRVGGAPVEEELALLEAAAEVDVERDLGRRPEKVTREGEVTREGDPRRVPEESTRSRPRVPEGTRD